MVEKNDRGEYVYVDESDDGQPFRTLDLVGRVDPTIQGIKKEAKSPSPCTKRICGETPSEDTVVGTTPPSNSRALRPAASKNPKPPSKSSGTLKNLVVLLYFNDHAYQNRSVPSQADIEILMNADEPDPILCPTGSLKGVYREISYGQLTIESTVTPWIVLSHSEAWYADNSSG